MDPIRPCEHKNDARIGGKWNILSLLLLLAWSLSGCGYSPGSQDATLIPTERLSTAIALTIQANRPAASTSTPSAVPSYTLTATETQQPPTLTPSPTLKLPSLTPTSGFPVRRATSTMTVTPEAPQAAIQILNPGPSSRVVSPIKVSAYLEPGARGNVRFELLGEDGRLLFRTIKSYYAGARVYVNLDIEYEISAAAEAGRLQITTEDSYGRKIALASEDLLLLSIGNSDLNPTGDKREKIIIQEPKAKTLIQGGKVIVSGLALTASDKPLLVDLLGVDGKPLGPNRLVNLSDPRPDGYAIFLAELPYSASKPTWARLEVYELDSHIPGITHLSSIEVLLSP